LTNYLPLAIKVWSDFACFTRPEFKAERVSYEVMTPSAARGVLEAVFWKPEFTWVVSAIHVLNPIRHYSIRRNEVNKRMSARSEPLDIADSGNRAQRHSLVLREVSYVIEATVLVKPGVCEDAAKYRDQFRRRLDRGQCYHRPYLGCREFAADFALPDGNELPIPDTRDLGLMLWDIQYGVTNVPVFFEAALDAGVLRVPKFRGEVAP
jgi:CRISPR-associated protein Cas5d